MKKIISIITVSLLLATTLATASPSEVFDRMYILLIEVAFIGYLFGNIKFLKKYDPFILLIGILVGLINSKLTILYLIDFIFFIYLTFLTIRTIKIKKEINSVKIFFLLIIILLIFNQVYYFLN